MRGRYGVDDLSKFLLGLSVAVMIVNLFVRIPLLNTAVLALFVWIYFRMFSRSFEKRYAENQKYIELKNRALRSVQGKGIFRADFKTHHVYRCPSCGQKIRVPRGRGHIVITCPKCRREFEKRS